MNYAHVVDPGGRTMVAGHHLGDALVEKRLVLVVRNIRQPNEGLELPGPAKRAERLHQVRLDAWAV